MRRACLVFVLLLAATAAPVAAYVGAPRHLERGALDLSFSIETWERDMDLSLATATTSRTQTVSYAGNRYMLRGDYALSEVMGFHALLGLADIDGGRVALNASGSSSQSFDGDAGFAWGLGGEANLPSSFTSSDVILGLAGEFLSFNSDISNGEIESDEWWIAFRGSRRFEAFRAYGGLVFSDRDLDISANPPTGRLTGSASAENSVSIVAGAEYPFSEAWSGRIEGEFISETRFGASATYRFRTGSSRYNPPAEEEPREEMAPPAPIPAEEPIPSKPPEETAPGHEEPVTVSPPPRHEEVPHEAPPEEKPPAAAPSPAPPPERVVDVAAAEEAIATGNNLASLGRYGEAILKYREAATYDPQNYRARYNLATTYYLMRDYRSALSAYQDAIRLNDRDPEAYLFLGFCHYRLGDLDSAARSWRRVLEIDPNNSVALNNLQAIGR